MFFLIHGTDTFRSRRKLAALRERFLATRDASGLNAATLRAADAGVDAVAESVYASPFLADRKLVILEGYLGLPADDQERIKEMLGKKPESTVVIFYESAGAEEFKKSPLHPLLSAQKFSEDLSSLSGAQLERFAVEECAAHGAKAEPAAARLLVEIVGNDTWRVAQEIEKLCAYAKAAAGGTVTVDAVRELVSGAREQSVFEFLDACVAGRCVEATTLLERLLDSGVAELQIVSMLGKQFRTLVAVRDLIARGERDKFAIAKKLGLHPFPAGKALAAARRHSAETLRERFSQLLEMERALKTSAVKARVALAVFAAKVALAQ